MLESLTCADFLPRLHQQFTMRIDDTTVVGIELVEAGESTVNPGMDGKRVPFSIVFRSAVQDVLPQRIYRVSHAEMGAFDLFLVPIGRDAEGVRYEAIFS